MSQTIAVDIWSDIACPWCYIGKRRFDAAVIEFQRSHPGVVVDATYHSFELYPETPEDYVGTEAEYLQQYRGIDPATQVAQGAQITALGKGVGIEFDFANSQHVNMLRPHRVLHLAKERGVQAQLKERLLAAYFEETKLLDDDGLVEVGTSVGLDEAEIRAVLADPEYAARVKADTARAQQLGIGGVPFYLIEEKYGISGAQESAAFVNVLEQVLELERTPDGGAKP